MDEEAPLSPDEAKRPTDCCFEFKAVLRFLLAWIGVADAVTSLWLLLSLSDQCHRHLPLGWSVVLAGANFGVLALYTLTAGAMHRSAFGLSSPLVYLGYWAVFWSAPKFHCPACGPHDDPSEPKDAGEEALGCRTSYLETCWRLDRRMDRPRGAAVALLLGALFASARAAIMANMLMGQHLTMTFLLFFAAILVFLEYLQFVFMQFCFCTAFGDLGVSTCCACCIGAAFGVLVVFGFPIGLSILLHANKDTGESLCLD